MKKIILAVAILVGGTLSAPTTALAGACEAIHTEQSNSCGGDNQCQAVADQNYFECLRAQVNYDN